ncbi:hypothetical protein DRJ00_08845 [Candidatus Aerophobetes bacterium]|uniref:YjgP/YjgQ family permease n=1 Tax=Aerophobetes bacterium TaxID=2030807 RepID=A0A497E1C2_UNCAE|nr:MAG: hypothetical protein DRJ00_08845 [Candidatus Aerophobetes bacterium]
MRILDRYITREYVRLYFSLIFFFVAIFLLTDFFQSVGSLKKSARFLFVLEYYLLQVPSLFSLLSPLAVVTSALFLITYLGTTHQIRAMQISGISIKRMSLPLLTAGLIISFSLLFLNQILVFKADQLAQKLKEENFVGTPQEKVQRNIFIHVPPSYLFYIRSFDPQEARMKDVLIYDSLYSLLIIAKEGRWEKEGRWLFLQGVEYSLKGELKGTSFDKKLIFLDKDPSYFSKNYFPPEKMNLSELSKYIDECRKSGFETLGLETELNFKISYPFTNFILLFLGIPIGLVLRKGGRGGSFALGLLISFSYYETMALFKTMGKGGFICPPLAAWIPNLIFLLGGIYLFARIE